MPAHRRAKALIAAAAAALAAAPGAAQLKSEQLSVETLPEALPPHWFWVNDVAFSHMTDGRAYLIDGDTGRFVGMVSAGFAHGMLALSPDGRRFALPATFHARGTRGERTDVITLYDSKDLAPGAEIIIPAKRFSGIPSVGTAPLTDDGRFALIYNFTPAQSVTVADLDAKALVGEFETPGCGLIYPTAPRRFMMQCGDGSLQNAVLDAGGKISLGGVSAPLFTADDPATEKPVRIGPARWLFFTYNSQVALIDGAGEKPAVAERWSLISGAAAGWRIGGLQPAAYHGRSGQLFALMHQGGPETHKDGGEHVWVFDVKSHKRLREIKLAAPASSIAVSGDDRPLLYAVAFGARTVTIYDATSGAKLREIGELGEAMTVIQPAPVAP